MRLWCAAGLRVLGLMCSSGLHLWPHFWDSSGFLVLRFCSLDIRVGCCLCGVVVLMLICGFELVSGVLRVCAVRIVGFQIDVFLVWVYVWYLGLQGFSLGFAVGVSAWLRWCCGFLGACLELSCEVCF